MRTLSRLRTRLLSDTEGSVTIWSLFALLVVLFIGGLSIDAAQAWRVRAMLQTAADVAAHGASVRMIAPSEDEAPRDTALRLARETLFAEDFEVALRPRDVRFGRWDAEAERFVANALPVNAVHVTTRRAEDGGNSVPTLLLGLVGLPYWNIAASAVATVQNRPTVICGDPLLSLRTRADIAGRDAFVGICLHARASVEYGGAEDWMPVASREFMDYLLASALTPETPELLGLTSLSGCNPLSGLSGCVSDPVPDLGRTLKDMVNGVDVTLDLAGTDFLMLEAGKSYFVNCGPREVAHVPGDAVLTNVVLLSDCPLRMEADASIRASLVISNLRALLNPLDLRAAPANLSLFDHVDDGSCRPGEGLRILLFADIGLAARLPALVDEETPIGQTIRALYEEGSALTAETMTLLGQTLDAIETVVSETETDLILPELCLGLDTLVTADTVALR